MQHEKLPTWIAFAAARLAAEEGPPTYARARDLVIAWMEWSSVLLLCDRYDRGAELDPRLEEAMRTAMTQPMGFSGWRAVFEALLPGPRVAAVLGVDPSVEFAPDHPVAAAIWAATGDVESRVDLVHFVRSISEITTFREDATPAILAAAQHLIAHTPAINEFTLCQMLRVDSPGGGFDVVHRAFRGTAWPSPRIRRTSHPPRFARGELVFWDGADKRVKVPDWLVQVNPVSLEPELYDGRETESREWRYRSARPGSAVKRAQRMTAEAPVVLSEPTWQTPAPAERLPSEESAVPQTVEAPPQRTAAPESKGPARYLLTVLAGRSYLRFCELSDDDSIVLGRNTAFAGFAIHHHEVSRSNTRVWTTATGDLYVQDLRSTNGTSLDGAPVGNEPERVAVGSVVSVGPVPVGVGWWSAEEVARLKRLVAEPGDSGRDLLTGLYTPRWLNESTHQGTGFSTEGEQAGLFLQIDRLGALHAQHGAEVADTVYQNVARALMSRLAAPGAAVRVGYGEIFALMPERGFDEAFAMGEEILRWAEEHRWDPKGVEVLVLGAVSVRQPGETVDEWVSSARKLAQKARTDKGRGQVYSERS